MSKSPHCAGRLQSSKRQLCRLTSLKCNMTYFLRNRLNKFAVAEWKKKKEHSKQCMVEWTLQFAHEQCGTANNGVQQNEIANSTTWQMFAVAGPVAWRAKEKKTDLFYKMLYKYTNGFGLQVVTNKWTCIFPAKAEAKCVVARRQVRLSAFVAVAMQPPPLCQWCLSCLHLGKFVRKRKIPFDWVFKRTQLPINVVTNKWKCWLTHCEIPELICEKKVSQIRALHCHEFNEDGNQWNTSTS